MVTLSQWWGERKTRVRTGVSECSPNNPFRDRTAGYFSTMQSLASTSPLLEAGIKESEFSFHISNPSDLTIQKAYKIIF